MDGTVLYSGVVAVHFEPESLVIAAHPNPFSERILMEINSAAEKNVKVSITDIYGKELFRRNTKIQKGQNVIELLPDPSLPSGLYMIYAEHGNRVQMIKVTKK